MTVKLTTEEIAFLRDQDRAARGTMEDIMEGLYPHSAFELDIFKWLRIVGKLTSNAYTERRKEPRYNVENMCVEVEILEVK